MQIKKAISRQLLITVSILYWLSKHFFNTYCLTFYFIFIFIFIEVSIFNLNQVRNALLQSSAAPAPVFSEQLDSSVTNVFFSADETTVFATSTSGTIFAYPIASPSSSTSTKAPASIVDISPFPHDSNKLLVLLDDGTVSIFSLDTTSFFQVYTPSDDSGKATAITFSPKGTNLLVATSANDDDVSARKLLTLGFEGKVKATTLVPEDFDPGTIVLEINHVKTSLMHVVTFNKEDSEYYGYIVDRNVKAKTSEWKHFEPPQPFGDDERYPTFYSVSIRKWADSDPENEYSPIFISTSSQADEFGLVTSNELPNFVDDSFKATIPFVDSDDLSESIIGTALDLVSTELIPEAYKGAEGPSNPQPIFWALDIFGSVLLWSVCHKAAIINNQLNLQNVMDDYVSYTLEDSPAPVPTSDKSGLDIQPTTATDTNVPSTGFVIPAVESTSSTPSTSSTSAFSAFSKPEGGNLFTGSATSFSGFGESKFGQSTFSQFGLNQTNTKSESLFGKANFGDPFNHLKTEPTSTPTSKGSDNAGSSNSVFASSAVVSNPFELANQKLSSKFGPADNSNGSEKSPSPFAFGGLEEPTEKVTSMFNAKPNYTGPKSEDSSVSTPKKITTASPKPSLIPVRAQSPAKSPTKKSVFSLESIENALDDSEKLKLETEKTEDATVSSSEKVEEVTANAKDETIERVQDNEQPLSSTGNDEPEDEKPKVENNKIIPDTAASSNSNKDSSASATSANDIVEIKHHKKEDTEISDRISETSSYVNLKSEDDDDDDNDDADDDGRYYEDNEEYDLENSSEHDDFSDIEDQSSGERSPSPIRVYAEAEIQTEDSEPQPNPIECSDYFYEQEEDDDTPSKQNLDLLPIYLSLDGLSDALPENAESYEAAEIQGIFNQINYQFRILSTNSLRMAKYIEANKQIQDRPLPTIDSLSDPETWTLSRGSDITTVIKQLDKQIKDILSERQTEVLSKTRTQLLGLRHDLDNIQELIRIRNNILDEKVSDQRGLPFRAAVLQKDIRTQVSGVKKDLNKLESQVTVVKSQQAHQSYNPSIRGVHNSIIKLNRLASEKSFRLNQLAHRYTTLKAGLEIPSYDNSLIRGEGSITGGDDGDYIDEEISEEEQEENVDDADKTTPYQMANRQQASLAMSLNKLRLSSGPLPSDVSSPFPRYPVTSSKLSALTETTRLDGSTSQYRHKVREDIREVLAARSVANIRNRKKQQLNASRIF